MPSLLQILNNLYTRNAFKYVAIFGKKKVINVIMLVKVSKMCISVIYGCFYSLLSFLKFSLIKTLFFPLFLVAM